MARFWWRWWNISVNIELHAEHFPLQTEVACLQERHVPEQALHCSGMADWYNFYGSRLGEDGRLILNAQIINKMENVHNFLSSFLSKPRVKIFIVMLLRHPVNYI